MFNNEQLESHVLVKATSESVIQGCVTGGNQNKYNCWPNQKLRRSRVSTKGFSPQAIETKACTRLSGLGTEAISSPTSGLERRLFPREPWAWCGGYFPASLGPD